MAAGPRRLLLPPPLVLLVVAAAGALLLPHQRVSAEEEKVSLELYYESLCPYCSRFIVNHLAGIFEDGLVDAVHLRLVPYGNARVGSNSEISCQMTATRSDRGGNNGANGGNGVDSDNRAGGHNGANISGDDVQYQPPPAPEITLEMFMTAMLASQKNIEQSQRNIEELLHVMVHSDRRGFAKRNHIGTVFSGSFQPRVPTGRHSQCPLGIRGTSFKSAQKRYRRAQRRRNYRALGNQTAVVDETGQSSQCNANTRNGWVKGPCYNCGQTGHYIRSCPLLVHMIHTRLDGVPEGERAPSVVQPAMQPESGIADMEMETEPMEADDVVTNAVHE